MKAIITADFHLRADRPRCRVDDWMEVQQQTLQEIAFIANANECPVCIVGDIFHWATVPEKIVIMFIEFARIIELGVYIMAGNHDLLYHSRENLNKSSYGILEALFPFFGHFQPIGKIDDTIFDSEIMFTHELIFKSEKNILPGMQAKTAQQLLEENPQKNWIFTGDNHHSFVVEMDGRYVVNPGCILRQTSDMKEYIPSVYLVDTNLKAIAQVFLTMDQKSDAIVDDYIIQPQERNERIDAFIDSIIQSGGIKLDFIENVNNMLSINSELKIETKNIIRQLLEETRNDNK